MYKSKTCKTKKRKSKWCINSHINRQVINSYINRQVYFQKLTGIPNLVFQETA